MGDTDRIVARLRDELAEARRELAGYTNEVIHPPEADLGQGSPGYATWEAAIALRGHIEQRIREIEDALRRAEQGLYGICESCGGRIATERLEALPFATCCITCASRVPRWR